MFRPIHVSRYDTPP